MIQVTCPNVNCGKLSTVKEEFAGRQARCPACGTVMNIPGGSPIAASARRVDTPPITPRSGQKQSFLERIKAWTAKVSRVPPIELVNYVLGGLSILGGLLTALLLGRLGATRPVIATRNMTAEHAEQIAREFARAQGTLTSWMVTYFAVLGILMLVWGAAAVGEGIVLSKRLAWGRLLSLVLAGFAGALGLFSIVPILNGYYLWVVSFLAYIGYAAWLFVVLTKPRAVKQLS
jgi:hypothetical protein